MVCSAAAFHSPEHLVVAVLATDETSPTGTGSSGCRTRRAPSRATRSARAGWSPPRSTTSARCCRRTSATGRGSAPTSARPTPHILLVIDGGRAAARQPRHPARRPARRHRARPPRALGRARRPDPAAAAVRADAPADGRQAPGHRAAGARASRSAASADQCDLATAEAFARRLAPLHTVVGTGGDGETAGPTDFMDLLGLGDVHTFDPGSRLAAAPRPRPAAGADRRRRGRRLGPPRHQGVRPAGHGPARPGDRRDRLRQVGVPAHAGARAGDDPLARARSTWCSSTSRAARRSPACPRCRTSRR